MVPQDVCAKDESFRLVRYRNESLLRNASLYD
jgi:hypothetical protein